jgi:hypothetical protein
MPSAIVDDSGSFIGAPAASDGGYEAAPAACTPMIRTSGRSALAATATPEISPPPPTAVMIVPTSGHWSRISRPTVP